MQPEKEYFYGLFSFLIETVKGNPMIDEYAFVSCIFYGSLLTACYLLLRKSGLLRAYTASIGTFLLYGACFILFLLPVDAPWQKRILLYDAPFNPIAKMMHTSLPLSSKLKISIWKVVILIWLIGCIAQLIRMAASRLRRHRLLNALPLRDVAVPVKLSKLLPRRTKVYNCCAVSVPFSTGFFRRRIYLPDIDYDVRVLEAILRHEGTHLRQRHHAVLFLTDLLCAVYWWNPLVYMLRSDVKRSLELRCDASAVQGSSREERADYMDALLFVFQNRKRNGFVQSPGLLGGNNGLRGELRERFEAIEHGADKNRAMKQSLLLTGLTLAILVLSLRFVLQPYSLPASEMISRMDMKPGLIVPVTSDSQLYQYEDDSYILENHSGAYDVSSWVEVLIEDGLEPVKRSGLPDMQEYSH